MAADHARGVLRPVEIANAGVFSALAVVLVSVGTLLPHLSLLELLAAVPFAIVGLRNRLRAVVASAIAAAFVLFLVVGVFAAFVVGVCAGLGGLCGILRRHGRGSGTVALVAAGLAPLSAAALVGLVSLFPRARNLAFGSIRATIAGAVRIAKSGGLPAAAGHWLVSVTDTLLNAWPVVLAAFVIAAVPAWMLATNALVAGVAQRVEWLAHADPLDHAARADAALDAPVAPLPLKLAGAGFRYGTGPAALSGADLTIEPGKFIAVVGPNGAGKSTLVALLAGAKPTSGWVRRPGRVGLGLPGGTAIVAQRAETQVIGSTVAEDLRWGLPDAYPVDVDALLSGVGLDGLGAASTESLSGGQLQRLAIAAAMARQPALLISDESTSMLDAGGRTEVLDLLAGLPARTGTTVVHVTHDLAEAARADYVIGLADGQIVDTPPPAQVARRAGQPGPARVTESPGAEPASRGKPVIRVRGVGHRFDAGTPWEVTALRSVDLDVHEGEGLLVTGENGSGKSTLAWVLAGLIRPTSGSATIDGAPASDSVGAAALSFQHARLQLQRPTVADDILAAAGFHAAESDAGGTKAGAFVRASLERAGLPADLAGRTIDALSGGQLRRVAIAGLLAARPRVLILDEPLAGLDRDSRRELLELLGRMRREEGLTLVVISHDLEDLGLACTRTVRVSDGTLALPDATAEPAPEPLPQPGRRRRTGLVLRPLPGTSPLHRLGAGPKLLVLAAATVGALFIPGWPLIGVLAALCAAGIAAARLPWTVVPRISPWIVALVVIGAVTAAAGYGIALYAQSLLIGGLFLVLSFLVIWTTRAEELPAAFARIAWPLRWVRAPVDEWAHTLTLTVRTLPLLRDEIRVLVAGRRLRAAPDARRAARVAGREVLDLVIAVVAASGRRATDLGRAATQRGGMRSLAGRD